jgi:hypothetical protein
LFGNLVELFSQLDLFVHFALFVFLLVQWLFLNFLFLLWFGPVKKFEQTRQLLDINRRKKSVVIVLKLFFSFLNEVFIGISEPFPMWKFWQIVLFVSRHTFFMNRSHFTVPISECP